MFIYLHDHGYFFSIFWCMFRFPNSYNAKYNAKLSILFQRHMEHCVRCSVAGTSSTGTSLAALPIWPTLSVSLPFASQYTYMSSTVYYAIDCRWVYVPQMSRSKIEGGNGCRSGKFLVEREADFFSLPRGTLTKDNTLLWSYTIHRGRCNLHRVTLR